MVPIIVVGLTVDYAIQIVSHYREQRTEGKPVVEAVRGGLANVTVPLTLAAVTTIASLLASLFSPIGIVGDFGIIAGLGVGMSLMVMLTLVPAGLSSTAGGRRGASWPRPAQSRTPCPASAAWRSSSAGTGGDQDAVKHRLGAARIRADDGTRPRSALGIATGRVAAVRFTAAITIAYSLIISILLVPPAMTIWGAYQNMRQRSMVQNWGTELDEAIDAVYRRQEQ